MPEHFIAFARETNDLRHRIDARVDRMFTEGLVDETRRLLGTGLAENRTAMQAIGYRQVTEHLRGERSLARRYDSIGKGQDVAIGAPPADLAPPPIARYLDKLATHRRRGEGGFGPASRQSQLSSVVGAR